jgi:hypothetical protein
MRQNRAQRLPRQPSSRRGFCLAKQPPPQQRPPCTWNQLTHSVL